MIPGAGLRNGIAVAEDGTACVSEIRPGELLYKVTPEGESTVFAEGGPLARPNGVAMDNDGNIFVVNKGSKAVVT